ncbi:MAG: recombinase family protein [Planctomycetota bacterium]
MMLEFPLVSKHADGVLRTIIPGRISKETQDAKSIAASQADNEMWLRAAYAGKTEITRLGEQASGWLADRPSMELAKMMIEADRCDLVLVAELRELFRNPEFMWEFVHNCIDHDTRFIAHWDQIDTAKEGWETNMHVAILKHGITVPETRRRVKRKATDTFSEGGMVLKVKYGYRKLTKDEALSGAFGPKGLRIAKVGAATPTIQAMRMRVLEGHSDAMVATWLNDEGLAAGPYSETGKWTGRLVKDLLTDPILSGRRSFRKTLSKMIYKTGKHKAVLNPMPMTAEECPELAHIKIEEQDDLLKYYTERKTANPTAHKSGRENPRWNVRRGDSIWPGQAVTCSACGEICYLMNHVLKCKNALSRGEKNCWNHVMAKTEKVRERVLPLLIAALNRDPAAKNAIADVAWAEYQHRRRGGAQAQNGIEAQLKEIDRQIGRMTQALKIDDSIESIVVVLGQLQKRKKALLAEKRLRDETSTSLGEYETVTELRNDLPRVIDQMARTSFEFSLLLRPLIPECVLVPIQALDCAQVRPRLVFTISFAKWAPNPETAYKELHTIDLFDPPDHIRHLDACVALRKESPGLALRGMEEVLQINYMTIKRSLAYALLMEQEGLTAPYRVLTEKPNVASRWREYEPRPPKSSG